ESGHDDNRQRRVGLLDAMEQAQTVFARHADIGHQDRRRFSLERRQSLTRRIKTACRYRYTRQGFFEYPTYALVVVDYPYCFHTDSRGRTMRNSVWPARESNSTTPPCC